MNKLIRKAAAVLAMCTIIAANAVVFTSSVSAAPTTITINGATSKPTASAKPDSTSSPTASAKPGSTSKPTASAKPDSTSKPSSGSEDSESTDEPEETSAPIQTIAPAATQQPEKAGFFGTKVSRGGLFGWSIFIIIVNALLSFMIANRFYRLSKKDNRIQAEIRALRRDIDEKMVAGIPPFSEKATGISDTNPDYSRGTKSIKVTLDDDRIPDEARDILAKWGAQIAASEQPEQSEQQDSPALRDRDITREMRISRNASRTQNRKRPAKDDADDEPASQAGGAKKKLKDLIDDIFPFGE